MTQYTESPAPGDLFPLLKEAPSKRSAPDSNVDDDVIFHMVTASMTTQTPK